MKYIARFQTWENGGERQFANKVFTNEHDVEADMKMSENSVAKTEYKEFSSEDEAWAWLQKEEEKSNGIERNNYTFLIFNSYDNSSYCFKTICSTYKEATEDYLSHMMGQQNSIMGKVTHDNVIKWEDGSVTILSILNGHILEDFSSWVKHVDD